MKKISYRLDKCKVGYNPDANELNLIPTMHHLYKYTKDSDLIFSCVSKAWLDLDRTRTIGEQAVYLRKRAIGHFFSAVNESRKEPLLFSQIDECNSMISECGQQSKRKEKELGIEDATSYADWQDSIGDMELLFKILKQTPLRLRKSMRLVYEGIMSNRLGQAKLTENNIRMFLDNVGYVSKNLLGEARELLNIIKIAMEVV